MNQSTVEVVAYPVGGIPHRVETLARRLCQDRRHDRSVGGNLRCEDLVDENNQLAEELLVEPAEVEYAAEFVDAAEVAGVWL